MPPASRLRLYGGVRAGQGLLARLRTQQHTKSCSNCWGARLCKARGAATYLCAKACAELRCQLARFNGIEVNPGALALARIRSISLAKGDASAAPAGFVGCRLRSSSVGCRDAHHHRARWGGAWQPSSRSGRSRLVKTGGCGSYWWGRMRPLHCATPPETWSPGKPPWGPRFPRDIAHPMHRRTRPPPQTRTRTRTHTHTTVCFSNWPSVALVALQ